MRLRFWIFSLLLVVLLAGCAEMGTVPAGSATLAAPPQTGAQVPAPPAAATPDPNVTPTVMPTRTPVPHGMMAEALWSAIDRNYVYVSQEGFDSERLRTQLNEIAAAGLSEAEFVAAIRAKLAELPPGTAIWQTPQELAESFVSGFTGYEGIGVYIGFRAEPQPQAILLDVVPGSPADQAGLQRHDTILAVDGEAVRAEEGMSVVNRIRGPAGVDVLLLVQSPGQEPRAVTVARQPMSFAPDKVVESGYFADDQIGYLLLPAGVHLGLDRDVIEQLRDMTSSQELQGLVIDLRISNNSTNWPLMLLLPLFTSGEVGVAYARKGTQTLTVAGQNLVGTQELPIALLLGPDTQGAPEIFAAAMQASSRATIFGLPTLGTVEGMETFRMPDDSRLLLATSSYRTPAGREVGLSGVEPDIPTAADWNTVTAEADPTLNAALEYLRQQVAN